MKNVVLVDYIQSKDWDFIRGLEEKTGIEWDIECLESSGLHGGFKNIIRYYTYFALAFRIFMHRKEYDRVIAWQQFFGLIISFYCRLFRVDVKKCPKLYVMELIYKPKNGFWGRLYERFIRYCIDSPYIERVFVFSLEEKEYYQSLFQTEKGLITSVHYGLEDIYPKYEQHISDELYYIAAGRSNRDYEFLIKEWPDERRLRIICDNRKLKVKEGIKQIENCYRDDYFKELAGCHAVIIPLKDKNASSGQLVMIQAMMLGKPIIVTENRTVRDYFVDEQDGFIVESKGEELRAAIEKLDSEDIWNYFSRQERDHFLKKHSMKAMGASVGKIIIGEKDG